MTKKQAESVKEFARLIEETKSSRILADYFVQAILEFYPNSDSSFRITLEDIIKKEYGE